MIYTGLAHYWCVANSVMNGDNIKRCFPNTLDQVFAVSPDQRPVCVPCAKRWLYSFGGPSVNGTLWSFRINIRYICNIIKQIIILVTYA
jgi:hypothetical protein